MFHVLDARTGEKPELSMIALKESWARKLNYIHIDQFYYGEDGTLILTDDSETVAHPPKGRFIIIPDVRNRDIPDNVDKYLSICACLADIYEKKNADYGDAFHRGFQKYGITSAVIRMGDKLSRLETLTSGKEAKVKDESIRDTLMDLAGYAIMTVMELDNQEG